jgi:hypothetical protein
MKRAAVAVALLIGAMLPAQASPQNKAAACIAKVIKSEELPYAPMGYWLVRVTLQVTPPSGEVFETTLQDKMPLQAYPPRRGETVRLWCDPADPTNLHLI